MKRKSNKTEKNRREGEEFAIMLLQMDLGCRETLPRCHMCFIMTLIPDREANPEEDRNGVRGFES